MTPPPLKCADKCSESWTKLEGAGSCPTTGDESSIQGFVDACTASVSAALGGYPLPTDVVTCNTNLDTCSRDLAACEVAPAAQSLKTGQTLCYNDAGAAIACAGTGQDGALQKGVPRYFTDNGAGTITDERTGLMWENLSNDGSIHDKDTACSSTNALAVKVAGLNTGSFAGRDDWRLPNAFELYTLMNLQEYNPATYSEFNTACPANCKVMTCSCTRLTPNCWTSSTYLGDATFVWKASPVEGRIFANDKAFSGLVRAVRTQTTTEPPPAQPLKTGQTTCYDAAGTVLACAGSGQDGDSLTGSDNSSTDNLDGTVTDNGTGLMREKLSDDGSTHDWDDTYTRTTAITAKIETLNSTNFAGHADWRLPNRSELLTLANIGEVAPATLPPFHAACNPGCTVTPEQSAEVADEVLRGARLNFLPPPRWQRGSRAWQAQRTAAAIDIASKVGPRGHRRQ